MIISSQRPNESDLGYAQRLAEHLAEEPKYIDLTPTWSGLMPGLIAAAGNGSQGAIDELMGLAATVDRLNAANKQAK